jgi:hypothetical protein
MRRLAGSLAILSVLLVASAGATTTGQKEQIEEALRLEVRAYNLYLDNPADPEVDSLLQQSIQLLADVGTLDPRNGFEGPDHELGSAQESDRRVMGEKDVRNAAIHDLVGAILLKEDALEQLRSLKWRYAHGQGNKPAHSEDIDAPLCTRRLAAFTPTGCFKVDYWDINVAANAKRARCTFTGPNGVLAPDRPLFAGTFQQTSCKLTNRYVKVHGVRKRVVHAELRITVPQDVTAKGSKPVVARAYWQ